MNSKCIHVKNYHFFTPKTYKKWNNSGCLKLLCLPKILGSRQKPLLKLTFLSISSQKCFTFVQQSPKLRSLHSLGRIFWLIKPEIIPNEDHKRVLECLSISFVMRFWPSACYFCLRFLKKCYVNSQKTNEIDQKRNKKWIEKEWAQNSMKMFQKNQKLN